MSELDSVYYTYCEGVVYVMSLILNWDLAR